MSRRIGLFGGSFNPVHLGHLRAAEEVRERAGLDEVWLTPAQQPPHKPSEGIAPAADRLAMLDLALAGVPGLHTEAIELERSGPSYTIDTVRALKARDAAIDLALILGFDAFRELHTWRDYEDLPRECDLLVTSRPPDQVVKGENPRQFARLPIAVTRSFCYDEHIKCYRHESGHRLEFVPITALDISASALRAAVAARRSIRFLVPDPVARHIEERGLYGIAAET